MPEIWRLAIAIVILVVLIYIVKYVLGAPAQVSTPIVVAAAASAPVYTTPVASAGSSVVAPTAISGLPDDGSSDAISTTPSLGATISPVGSPAVPVAVTTMPAPTPGPLSVLTNILTGNTVAVPSSSPIVTSANVPISTAISMPAPTTTTGPVSVPTPIVTAPTPIVTAPVTVTPIIITTPPLPMPAPIVTAPVTVTPIIITTPPLPMPAPIVTPVVAAPVPAPVPTVIKLNFPANANYIGCFKDSTSARALPTYGGLTTAAGCQTASRAANSRYFGLQYPNGSTTTAECWYDGTNTSSPVQYGLATTCTAKNSYGNYLGASNVNAVYDNMAPSISPSYMGCYLDKQPRALPTLMGVTTVQGCANAVNSAVGQPNTYFGMQNPGKQYPANNAECWYNSTGFNPYGKATTCTTKNSSGQYLGASSVNSVYKV